MLALRMLTPVGWAIVAYAAAVLLLAHWLL